MFAVKQITRCLSHRIQSTVSSKIYLNHPVTSFFPAQSASLVPHAYFSCTTKDLTSTLEKLPSETGTLVEHSLTLNSEPDVLYHMIEIEIRGSDKVVLQSYNTAISLAAEHLGLTIGFSEIARKPHIKRWTVLKSRHVHGKHWMSYEVRTYHHKLQINRLTGSTADTFLEYIQRNLPEGVSMRVGRVRMEKLPDHLLIPPLHEE